MRQHQTALFISNDDPGALIRLEPLRLQSGALDQYSEEWLRDLIFAYPESLPISEVEPVMANAKAVCTELPTDAGPADLLLMTGTGGLVLIECKLWRNPEARRKVVAQIIDYARCMTRWGYDDLDRAVRAARFPNSEAPARLADLFSQAPDFDEAAFVDSVSRNLRRGRVLLLIAGDGIREEIEELAGYLQDHAGFHFALALVEMALHDAPTLGGRFVQPRVVARTVTIERGIVTAHDSRIAVEAPVRPSVAKATTRRTISMEEFLEQLEARFQGITPRLLSYLEQASSLGIEPEFLRSLNLKWPDPSGTKHNLGYVQTNGGVWLEAASWKMGNLAEKSVAEAYRQDVAAAVGGEVRTYSSGGERSVYLGGKPLYIDCALEHSQGWLAAMRRFIEAMTKLHREAAAE